MDSPGGIAYVANLGTISAIDTVTHRVVDTIRNPNEFGGALAVDSGHGILLLSHEPSGMFSVMDTTTHKVLKTFTPNFGGRGPFDIQVDSANDRAYITASEMGAIVVLNTKTLNIDKLLTYDGGSFYPWQLAIDPATNSVFVKSVGPSPARHHGDRTSLNVLHREDLAGRFARKHGFRSAPLGGRDEQGATVGTTQRAREAAAIDRDGLEDFTAFADANALLVRYVGVPDGAFGIDADPVRHIRSEIGPHPAAREAAILFDVVRREPIPVGLRHDQGRVARRHSHAVGEPDVVGDLATHTIWGHNRDGAACRFGAGHQIEPDLIDEHVAAPIHRDLVPAGGEVREIGVSDERAVDLLALEPVRNDEEPAVRQPVQ